MARYEGLDLEGFGPTEGLAKRHLVKQVQEWVFESPGGKEAFVGFLRRGGSRDIRVFEVDARTTEIVKEVTASAILNLPYRGELADGWSELGDPMMPPLDAKVVEP